MKPVCTAFLFFITVSSAIAQQGKDSMEAIGTHFKTGGSKNFWMGSNYRQEWNTPIKVPIMDLSKEKGGLTPIKKGGGRQTKSLHLEDAQGNQYTIRSVQKFITSKTLPGGFESEAAVDIVSDGVSASYPYAAVSVSVLSEAAGVPHTNPRLVYITDDPKLGEFREDFKNMLVLFDEKLPDSVKKGYDTDEVADRLKDDNDNRVDQLALLKVRLLDMFIMDFDRHELQWVWGAYDNGKGKTFYPIAKDRDQAFFINRGLIPGIAKKPWLLPQIQGMKAHTKSIDRFNFTARNLDRFFLNELNEQDWKNEAEKLVAEMTDEVIEKALHKQPAPIQPYHTEWIIGVLKERKKYFVEEAMEYYHFLSAYVNVTASDKKELFDIDRKEDGSVALQVFKINKSGEQSSKMYDRTFDPSVTKELRLYGFGNDDKFVVHGNNDKIKIRMIGGDGNDEFVNNSSAKGGIVYDDRNGNNKITGSFKNKMSKDSSVNSFNRLYYKYNVAMPFISVAYNQDDGLFLGVSLKITHHGFRKDPYKTMHQFSVNHALATNSYHFKWYSEFIGVFGPKTDLLFETNIKAPNNTINFFSYGMNSVYNKNNPGKFRYYRARFHIGDISFMLRKNFSKKVNITFGPMYEFFSLDSNDNKNKYILQTGLNGLNPNTVFKSQSFLGARLGLNVDTRDNKLFPKKGFLWMTELRQLAALNSASNTTTQLNSKFSFYLPLGKSIILADRFGGGYTWGNFEFYHAQFLGSEEDLRGYRKTRFAGRSKIFNDLELRMKLGNFHTYFFPGSWGVLLFSDNGRVWTDNVTTSTWANGYGVGLWFAPLNRLVISVSYMASKEDKLPLVGLGWRF